MTASGLGKIGLGKVDKSAMERVNGSMTVVWLREICSAGDPICFGQESTLHTTTGIVRIAGHLTAVRYLNDIIRPSSTNDLMTFTPDNARLNTAL